MDSISDLPRMKLLGRKAISEPDISMTLRMAMMVSIKLSWNRSTISEMSYSFLLLHAAVFDRRSREARLTGTHDLKQILLFELLKYSWESVKQY